MMNNCMGIINLDENESNMGDLIKNRPLASIPIAARYKVIDFILSNMTNSGIDCIGIFVKNKSKELVDHLSNGKPWDLDRRKENLRVFNFSYKDPAFEDVHKFLDNIEFIKYSKKKYVIMAPSYMICNIDFNIALENHIKSKNNITMIYKNTDEADNLFINCEILNLNKNGRVVSIEKNLGDEKKNNINMEMYIMEVEIFLNIIEESIRDGIYKKIKDFIHSNLDKLTVGTYKFEGYLNCVNSVNSYYSVNMDLLKDKANKELFYEGKPIYTKIKDEPPTYYGNLSDVNNSIIANGCSIEGEIKNSIISKKVYIGEGCKIENSVIMKNVEVGIGPKVNKSRMDERKHRNLETWKLIMKRKKIL